jgi:hypothetical protein
MAEKMERVGLAQDFDTFDRLAILDHTFKQVLIYC